MTYERVASRKNDPLVGQDAGGVWRGKRCRGIAYCLPSQKGRHYVVGSGPTHHGGVALLTDPLAGRNSRNRPMGRSLPLKNRPANGSSRSRNLRMQIAQRHCSPHANSRELWLCGRDSSGKRDSIQDPALRPNGKNPDPRCGQRRTRATW